MNAYASLVKPLLLGKNLHVQAVHNTAIVSVEDYLAGEAQSDTRHEYLGGIIYAMAGASSDHNLICLSLASALRSHLRGKGCQVFMSDMKVGLRVADEDIFYYPDVLVSCDARDSGRDIKQFPKLIIEVLSSGTERIDRHEKLANYAQIETLEEYVLVAQDAMEVTLYRRANNWRPEVSARPDQELRIPSLNFAMPLSAIYEGCGH